MNTPLTRRRFFALTTIVAAGVATPLILSRQKNTPQTQSNPTDTPVVWKGIALGSGAELRLYHVSKQQAQILADKAMNEVARLEKIFSLYREDSLISRLNREGRLNNPPSEFLELLSICRDLHRVSKGAFDPTIQPLWQMYAEHFRKNPQREDMPSEEILKRTLALVNFNHVEFDNKAIRFTQKGMGLSLNGIAQGYITDKVVEILRKNGVEQALVDMGEIRGLDTRKTRQWQVGIRNPQDEQSVLLNVPIQNQAFATSGGYGTTMDEKGKFTHLFDPRTGLSQPRYLSVSVMAQTAAVADACSTAFSVMELPDIESACKALNAQVWLVLKDGQLKKIG